MLSLFDQGSRAAGPGKSTTALTMLDYGRRQAGLLKNNPDFQTELFAVLGGLYEKLGHYDQANSLLEAALAGQAVDKNVGAKARAQTLIDLGLLRKDQSRFPEAESLVRRGLDLPRQNSKASQHDIAQGEAALGNVLVARENFKDAIRVLDDAVHKQTQFGAESEQASALNDLAGAPSSKPANIWPPLR